MSPWRSGASTTRIPMITLAGSTSTTLVSRRGRVESTLERDRRWTVEDLVASAAELFEGQLTGPDPLPFETAGRRSAGAT